MNDLVLIVTIIFLMTRVIGFWVSLELYLGRKRKLLIIIIIGWIVWILATIGTLIQLFLSNVMLNSFLNFLTAFLSMLGGYLYLWGLNLYIFRINNKLMVYLLVILSILAFLIGYIINFEIATLFCLIGLIGMLLFTFYVPIANKDNFTTILGRTTYLYYSILLLIIPFIIVSIYIPSLGYEYNLLDAEDPVLILIYYIPSITISILLSVLLIHIEYTITEHKKDQMKDKFSHNLGNILQTISLIFSLDGEKKSINDDVESEEMNSLLKSKIDEAANILKEIRKL